MGMVMNTLIALLASTLTLVSPENGAEYDTHTPCVKEFLSHYDERGVKPEVTEEELKDKYFNCFKRNAWSEDWLKRLEEENKTYKPFSWKADFPVNEAWVEFSETDDFAKPLVEWLRYGKKPFLAFRPGYLKVNQKYFWRVKAKDAADKEVISDVRTFTTKDAFPRLMGENGSNYRDVGGGVNADGKRIRQGLLYRGGAAPVLDYPPQGVPSTLETLKALFVDKFGCVGELDLRGQDEGDEAEKKWRVIQLEKIGLKKICCPLVDYHIEHPHNLDMIPKCFHFLADKSNYPVYVHCAVGCDRTGTLFALLDGILGRTDRQVVDEYEISSLCRNLPRFRYGRKFGGLLSELSGDTALYGAKTVRENAEKYLLKIGVPQAEIDAIRDIMIEK